MDQDIAYDYEKLCEHFGIDHSKNDADKRLLSALRAGNKTKKKAGRKREWTGNRQFDFFWDCVQAEILCKKKLHRRPKKKELAEEMVRLYRDKYGDADRIRTMLSGAHLRPVNQHVLRTKEFSVSALAPSREHMKAQFIDKFKIGDEWDFEGIKQFLHTALDQMEAAFKKKGWSEERYHQFDAALRELLLSRHREGKTDQEELVRQVIAILRSLDSPDKA
jgi:hypothetical protein